MYTLNLKGKLKVVDKPMVMGILNITPDSFFGGSRVEAGRAAAQAAIMLEQGADMIDIGGQSTRPGSQRIGAGEEADRVLPAIASVAAAHPDAIISVDTYYASVANYAVAAGATVVNDISGGTYDGDMLATVAAMRVPFICMHMTNGVGQMHKTNKADHSPAAITDYFTERIAACAAAGINDIILDPGFGFGKSLHENYGLLASLQAFEMFGRPLLVGVSRKRMVYELLGISAVEALNGTTALHTVALQKNANILRVHDVKEAVECIKIYNALLSAGH